MMAFGGNEFEPYLLFFASCPWSMQARPQSSPIIQVITHINMINVPKTKYAEVVTDPLKRKSSNCIIVSPDCS